MVMGWPCFSALPHRPRLTSKKRGTYVKEEKAAFCRDFIEYFLKKHLKYKQHFSGYPHDQVRQGIGERTILVFLRTNGGAAPTDNLG